MPLTPKVSGNRSPDEIREACENFPGFHPGYKVGSTQEFRLTSNRGGLAAPTKITSLIQTSLAAQRE
jgi:hypothetical protein